MKKIEAIFRPAKLDDVRNALEKIGLPGVTILQVEVMARRRALPSSGVARK